MRYFLIYEHFYAYNDESTYKTLIVFPLKKKLLKSKVNHSQLFFCLDQ